MPREDVEIALRRAVELRRNILRTIGASDRQMLLEHLFEDFFVTQRATLLKWAALTGQSAQVDTGYIAQHVASIVLAEPGQGFKGKGLDLADGSEVKSAAILSGVDRPRWNHNMGTPSGDDQRRARGLQPQWQNYLSAPYVFYLLFDRVRDPQLGSTVVLRVRAWCVDAQSDLPWRDLLTRFIESRAPRQYNLQLHPPVGYDDSIVVNTLGNLDMSAVKMLEARMTGLNAGDPFNIEWTQPPPATLYPITGRCLALGYGGRGARPSRLNTAADVTPDFEEIARLLPSVDVNALREASSADAVIEANELSQAAQDEERNI